MIKIEDMTDGLYYVKEKHGVEVGDWDSDHKIWNGIWGGDDTEVLAPVPSYEEWQASEKYNKHLEEKIKIYERKDKQATETSIAYNELAKENAILKELLKECKEVFDECFSPSAKHGELYKEIDEALK